MRRPVVRAACSTLVTAVVLAVVVAWAHELPGTQRDGSNFLYAVSYLVLAASTIWTIAAWTLAAVAVARRLDLTATTLRREAWLAVMVSLAMVAITAATTIWWVTIAAAAPGFLGGDVPVTMLALLLTMVAATGAAATGAARSLRTTRLIEP